MKQLLSLRIIGLLLALVTCSLAVLAVPAKPGWHTITQSDGTTLQVRSVGDEFCSALLTSDDLMVARGKDGDFYYKTTTGLTTMMAHEPVRRSAVENSFINAQQDNLKWQALLEQSSNLRLRSVGGSNADASVPATGSRRIPVILVQFQDIRFKNTRQQIINSMITGNKGVQSYFRDQSNGNYEPTFDVYGIYTLSHNREYYGGHNGDLKDQRLGEMATEACQVASAHNVRFNTYDTNNDDYCDVFIVIYAGVGEAQASTTHPEAIWPCHSSLSRTQDYTGGNGAFRPSSGDPLVDEFAVFNELDGDDDSASTIDGIGTFAHEFGHCLGLPDLYDTKDNYYYGMGHWDIMGLGCYNDNGYTPAGYSAYEKVFMGWISYITLPQNRHYTLPVWNQKSASTDKAIRIVSSLNSNEYFILENRRKQGWDEYLPGEGILITHVVYVANRWKDNTVNTKSIQLYTIMPADNYRSYYNEGYDLWPYGDNIDFTDDSSPSAKLNLSANGNIVSNAGYLGKPVVDMTINSDGTASLWYMPPEISINSTNFPDANFRNYLLSLYPNGYLTYKDIRSCTIMDVPSKNISNLKGIEYFTELESLNCSGNRITSLDLSYNTKLIDLFCQDNTSLTSLSVTNCAVLERLNCSNTSISSLYVLNCTKLRNLICENTKLTSLTVTGISTLKNISCSNTSTLKTLNCYNNSSSFTHLYISGCTGLETLICYANANLHTLYGLADCTAITYLDCEDCAIADLSDLANLSNLEKVYARNNKLTTLDVTNKSKLTTLRVKGNTTLTELRCFRNALTSLDVTGCTALKSLHCYDNANLATITGLADCKAITYLDCEDCAITSLSAVSGMNDIETLLARNNKITSLSVTDKSKLNTLRLSGNTALLSLYCYNCELTSLIVTGCTALTMISCYGNANLTTIMGLADCKAIVSLYCYNCAMTGLSALSGMTNLTTLYCFNNKLTSLKITGCTALSILRCFNNTNLTAITGLGDCKAITYLDCNNCAITDLSGLANLSNLEKVYARNNKITSLVLGGKSRLSILEVSDNTLLTELRCDNNALSTLDITNCTSLKNLWCWSNASLTSITGLASCKAVESFYCYECALITLEGINGMTNLSALGCNNNNLISLSVTDKSKLYYLNCSNNTMLTTLNCYNNALISLNVTGSTALNSLKCFKNPNLSLITGLADCKAITYLDCEDCAITDLNAVQSMTSIKTFLARNNQLSGEFNLNNKSQLTNVHLNGNSGLTRINCYNNPSLQNLDVSYCTGMTILSCYNNTLISLDLTGCASLSEMSCRENRLQLLSFEDCNSLKKVWCYKNIITEAGMNYMISTLPTRTAANRGELLVMYNTGETNVFTDANAAAARAKYWIPMVYDGSTWVELTASTRGDVDGDGNVKITDVTALINYLLSHNATGVDLTAADCDQDGSVNIADVTTLINYLLSHHW